MQRRWLGSMILLALVCISSFASAAPPGPLDLLGHDDGRLGGRFRQVVAGAVTSGLKVSCRLGEKGETLTATTGADGAWVVTIPDKWRAQSDQLVHVTVGEGDTAATAVYSLHRMPLPYLPPTTVWGDAREVDEPLSAFYSIGRTPYHFGRNAELISRFHEYLRTSKIDPVSLLDAKAAPPKDLRRILIEPELLEKTGWTRREGWIVAAPGERGPEARLPLKIERGGMYRVWIRYMGYKDGAAVSGLTLRRTGSEQFAPLMTEEFHTRVAGVDGPRWHDFMVNLEPGDYSIALDYVINYHHTPRGVPSKERQVDCIYLTDELWRDAPSDEQRAELSRRVTAKAAQRTDTPPLTDADQATWKLWQVRPTHWETATANPRLFSRSQEFWRREIAAIAEENYFAPPHDPIAGGIADYRDPRRQVVFDPIWNMVGNPYRIRSQRLILEQDIDPLAKDAYHEWIAPGHFPVVLGQWQRSNGGLTADHAATQGFAAGTYTLPRTGQWHLWANFKNINYFEYFGVFADTLTGRAATWERTERLYPGGRSAWAKVGTIEVPHLSDAEIAAHKAAAAKGVLVAGGKNVFAVTQGEWKPGDGWMETTSDKCRIDAKTALNPKNDFHIRARLAVTGLKDSGAAFTFRQSHGALDNTVGFEGAAKGAAFGKDTTFDAAAIKDGQPFDFELIRTGETGKILLNGKEALAFKFADAPGAIFGFQPGKGTLRLVDFSAAGGLDDGLEMRRQVKIALWMDKYINARTYRGVYGLYITDDGDYKPEGSLAPKPSPTRFFGHLKACGFSDGRGYVLNASPGIGLINQTWMPAAEPKEPVIDLVMARDTVRSAALKFRSGSYDPLTVTIAPGPLTSRSKRQDGAVRWRAVAFAPYGNGREEWSPFLLLRRPYLSLPPLAPAQAWLTVDSTGLSPGTYESKVVVNCSGPNDQKFAPRTVRVRVRVADVRVQPKNPILVHGWVTPPPGEEYLADWFKRFNVWQGPLMSKQEMAKFGLKLQVIAQWNHNDAQIRSLIDAAKAKGLGYDDWMFSIMDEPTGQNAEQLKEHIAIAKLIRAADPQVKITMNPGEAARAPTFSILQPYVDLWNPYALHLSYGPSGRDYLKKPWIWYTTPCYQDKTPGLAGEIYTQVRSVLQQPGDCRGTAFFAPYYPWRDPWDTAYEHIKDVSAFVLPSRRGPVATPAWEALRESVQHANLARMVRERAKPTDTAAKPLWETGSVEEIIAWLEKH